MAWFDAVLRSVCRLCPFQKPITSQKTFSWFRKNVSKSQRIQGIFLSLDFRNTAQSLSHHESARFFCLDGYHYDQTQLALTTAIEHRVISPCPRLAWQARLASRSFVRNRARKIAVEDEVNQVYQSTLNMTRSDCSQKENL